MSKQERINERLDNRSAVIAQQLSDNSFNAELFVQQALARAINRQDKKNAKIRNARIERLANQLRFNN